MKAYFCKFGIDGKPICAVEYHHIWTNREELEQWIRGLQSQQEGFADDEEPLVFAATHVVPKEFYEYRIGEIHFFSKVREVSPSLFKEIEKDFKEYCQHPYTLTGQEVWEWFI